MNWIIDWSDLKLSDKADRFALLEEDSQSGGGGDQSRFNGDDQTLDSQDQPLDNKSPDVNQNLENRFFPVNNNEISPPKSRRKSHMAKIGTSSSGAPVGGTGGLPGGNGGGGGGDRRKGALKFAQEATTFPLQGCEESPLDLADESAQMSVVKRFQQRWVRRSRAGDDSGYVSGPYVVTSRTWSKVPTEQIYLKSPSFDYSSVTSRHRNFGSRKRHEGTGTEYSERVLGFILFAYRSKKVLALCLRFPCRPRLLILIFLLFPIRTMKVKDMNNDHICRLIGICLEPGHQFIVNEYCPRGSLQDFLRKEQFTMEWMFKLSLIQDICRRSVSFLYPLSPLSRLRKQGMIYLHQIFGPHGNLKSSNCLLDSRFAVKVTDFGLSRVRGPKPSKAEIGEEAFYGANLSRIDFCNQHGSAFHHHPCYFSVQQIIEAVRARRKPSFRPTLVPHDECNEDLVQLIRRAWDDDPMTRPDFRAIGKLIVTDAPGNLVDNLLDRMQHYTNDLEAMVLKRTEQYKEEKKRAEDLLYSMLPQSVASQLISKKTVQAESFEMVTIYFSDIVGFTSLSAESTPMQVVELLNQLYTLFDDIIGNFDVYKVETIGDAYMVASGLPKPNGLEHARAVARMSIAFLKAIFEFQIPHRPDKRLELRIGIHSGPVCAGVVGQKMPRYCLFGDTVNTSSRMESNGLRESAVHFLCSIF
ncbi:Guanylate cyclase [Fasciola gigantica]|uniref:Guanylate cyclase n=1 Tax=Fasciola gigantica TaxID=46835 RepID=A0A504YBS3_FASGI|nr:Guanylate cyclase [Fasciola gigantica]